LACRGFANLMAAQLAKNIRHENYKVAKSRLGDVPESIKAGGRWRDYERGGQALECGPSLAREGNRLRDTMNLLRP